MRFVNGMARGGAMALALVAAAAGIDGGRLLAQAAAPAEKPAVTVLDAIGVWRMHHVLKPPVVQRDDGQKPLLAKVRWLDWETPGPSADWTGPEADDSTWMRGPARRSAQTPHLGRLCLRGKFEVTDPARVKGLALSVACHGGAVAYVNGQEVGRVGLPAGADPATALAEAYPREVFVKDDGGWLLESPPYSEEIDWERLAGRVRVLDAPIPSGLLREGVNVVAVAVVRAPYHPVVVENKPKDRGYVLPWNTCEIRKLRLTADGAGGLVPNVSRPSGAQAWNADVLAGDTNADYGDRTERLRPVVIVGARNGTFTGKVVVGRDLPIRELKATAGDLQAGAATIPAGQVSFRYGVGGGSEVFPQDSRQPMSLRAYPYGVGFRNHLLPEPPPEYPVSGLRGRPEPGMPPPRNGAVAPVWIQVRVPKDAAPGTYEGAVTVAMADERPLTVPVQLKVTPWTMPDAQDYRTWLELVQSPDTLAVEYGVPLWSDRHWELIAQSFRLLSPTGTRAVYVPVIAHTNHGNAESMVRWIKQPLDQLGAASKVEPGQNQYAWDFTPMEKYLDLAIEHLGTPKLVGLQVWEVYMGSKESTGRRFGETLEKQQALSGGAPLVTFLDPATGKTENGVLPRLADPDSKPAWRELLKQVHERLRRRGLEKTLMLGLFSDSQPSRDDARFFHEIAPGVPWVQQGHMTCQSLHGIAEVGYNAAWWDQMFCDDTNPYRTRDDRRQATMTGMHGWNRPRLDALYERSHGLERYPLTRWRFECEAAITGEMRGVGRIGADFWKPVKDNRGRRISWVHERFPDGNWKAVGHDLNSWVLEPHDDGPIATTRLQAIVDGMPECEARITIEKALLEQPDRLGDDLARRCQEVLDGRIPYMWKSMAHMEMQPNSWGVATWRFCPAPAGHAWFLNTHWQARTEELFALAGEVQRKLGK